MTKNETLQPEPHDDADLVDVLARWAREQPDAPAVIEGDLVRSWSQCVRRCFQVAHALQGTGLQPGQRVAWLSRNNAAVHETFLGTLAARGCAVPLPTMASGEALLLVLQDCGATHCLVAAEFRTVAEELRTRVPDDITWVAFDFDAPGFANYEHWLASAASDPPDSGPRPDDAFNVIYSSGTTGTPKGILHRHRMRVTHAEVYAKAMRPGSVNLVSTPLYSNTTIVIWFPCLWHGGTTVLMGKFSADQWLASAERHRVTHAMLVPVQYDRLLRSEQLASTDLSELKFKFCTSAPMREDLKRRAVLELPGRFIEYYGLTEGGVSTVLLGNVFPDKLASVGKCYEGELMIIDEDGNALPAGRTGEIVGRNALMMDGYVNRQDATDAMTWRDPAGRLFFRSGDVGRLDEDGFLYLSDRKKDVIISGGFNVYATDLEQVLDQHPAVREVAVIGVPSERWGETPLALAVLEPSAGVAAEDLLAWANERLGKGQRLSAIELRDHLPKSEIGKVLKRHLRVPYWKPP